MTDWADEIAARLCNMDRDNREESHQVYLEMATALRAAELRGRVAGMAELEEWRAARQAIFDMPFGNDMKPLFSRLADAEHKLMDVARSKLSPT